MSRSQTGGWVSEQHTDGEGGWHCCPTCGSLAMTDFDGHGPTCIRCGRVGEPRWYPSVSVD